MSSILDNFVFAPEGGKKISSALRETWTLTLKLATDFKSVVSTYSTIKANRKRRPHKKIWGLYIIWFENHSLFMVRYWQKISIIDHFLFYPRHDLCLSHYLSIIKRVHPIGFEPMTNRLEGDCSIQLSYGCLFLIHII